MDATHWKFRQWSPPVEGKFGKRKLVWHSGLPYEIENGPLEGDPAIDRLFEEASWWSNNLTDEGESDFIDVYFNDQAVRSTLYIRGFNYSINETSTLTTISSEETGSGYAALSYTRGTDWTHNNSQANGTTKSWTATGTWNGIRSLAIATVSTGTAGLLIAYVNLNSVRVLAVGESLDITPTVTMT